MNSDTPPSLTVSIVVYTLDKSVLTRTLESLQVAARRALDANLLRGITLYLIDNAESDTNTPILKALLEAQLMSMPEARESCVLSGHGNIGYGRAHNLAISRAAQRVGQANDLFLILNPDVIVQPDTLCVGIDWMASHQQTVAVAPAISDGNGHTASACKRYPSVLDFVLRGFAPTVIKKHFAKRLAHYDMQDLPSDRPSEDIPVISGCFMLFRQSILQQLNGFDPGYFLYFEDFDLALRAHTLGTLTYLPAMRITHLGGHSAKKGLRHIGMFGRSGFRFFNTHGWRWS